MNPRVLIRGRMESGHCQHRGKEREGERDKSVTREITSRVYNQEGNHRSKLPPIEQTKDGWSLMISSIDSSIERKRDELDQRSSGLINQLHSCHH